MPDSAPDPCPNGVLVGVDGSASALAAVRWAAREAYRTGDPVTLVHAYPADGGSDADREPSGIGHREQGLVHLHEAEIAASASAPGVRVTTRLRGGEIRQVLLDESGRARQVVLGSRGAHSGSRLVLGSAGLALAMRGRCPVVVVHDRVPDTGPVVVGLDGWPECAPAARFAFLWAAGHGTSVTAVRTWHAPATTDSARIHEQERGVLAGQLAALADEFPEVSVEQVVLRGFAGQTLLDYGGHARLLVVGARGRTGLGRLLPAATSMRVARQSPSPVAVIRSAEVVRRWQDGCAAELTAVPERTEPA